MSSHRPTERQLQIMFQTLDIDPITPNKDSYHTPQNHSTQKICLLVSDEGTFQISSSYSVPKLRYRTLRLGL